MSEMKFTPGPWKVFEYADALWVDGLGRQTICRIANNGEAEANARLIAAAPEMYEALKSLIVYGGVGGVMVDASLDKLQAAASAIAKAEGES